MSNFLLNGWVEDIGTGLLFGIPSLVALWKKIERHHRENVRLHESHAERLEKLGA